MFTGVVNGCFPIETVETSSEAVSFSLTMNADLSHLENGQTVSIDGVGLPFVHVEGQTLTFNANRRALKYTTLRHLYPSRRVNIELPAAEGGCLISGNVIGVVRLAHISGSLFSFEAPREWMKYLLSKGFVALDGVRLLVEATYSGGVFSVIIDEDLLEKTTFGFKDVFDEVNLEVDPYTEVIVSTVESLCLDSPCSFK